MPATPSGVLARTATIAAMSSLALVATAAAAGAADATASAMDSSSPVGYAVFGIPVATTVWLLAGVLAVLVGLIGCRTQLTLGSWRSRTATRCQRR